MKTLKIIFALTFALISNYGACSEVQWTSRLEGDGIQGGIMTITDGDYDDLILNNFVDVNALGYIRLGLTERVGMDFTGERTILVELQITPYDIYDVAQASITEELEVVYSSNGTAGITVDGSDYRMPGIHKFEIIVVGVIINGGAITDIPSYVYLEGGFQAERYYELNTTSIPEINAQMIKFDEFGGASEVGSPLETDEFTDEIYLTWDYVDGAEYYDLEWTWVDNYGPSGLTNILFQSDIDLDEQEFKYNSTRIRTSDQFYKIPQIFAKGYVIYRVRGVGRWMDDPTIDKYGEWSSNNGQPKDLISDWSFMTNDVLKITFEHEEFKNWQYQATYAEDGKKKEVTQYFDGSLRGRQTVTRINSDNHSVVGETIYDNLGRGVIQVLPVPQENPAIRYYPELNKSGLAANPYSHLDFDWEDPIAVCEPMPAEPLDQNSGAGNYYSVNGNVGAEDWQQYVPESNGYAFTQVEYTPDNTGRIRNQSGVGAEHKIGSDHETFYYYTQPTQEELNRLFGYKVGFMSRYKKNMVVDANGQVSVSYLDAQGRVVATAMAGENLTDFESLTSESDNTFHSESFSDLLNKSNETDPDTEFDNNELFSTGTFGAVNDGLLFSKQLGVIDDGTNYDFFYDIKTYSYSESCDVTQGVSYPYVYDLKLSLIDDCGVEKFTSILPNITVNEIQDPVFMQQFSDLDFWVPAEVLNKGTYTLSKTLTVNEEALLAYKADYLSENNLCLLPPSAFTAEISTDCGQSCDDCVLELGDLVSFLAQAAQDEGSPLGVEQTTLYTEIYIGLKDACMAPCSFTSSCDAFREMLLQDVRPLGQYGDVTSTDALSVYNDSQGILSGNWLAPFTPYLNIDGTPSMVDVYYDGTVYLPLLTSADPAAASNYAPGYYQVAPTELLTVASFSAVFQPQWAESLLPFHPEYPLYEYVEEICSTPHPIPTSSGGTIDLTSDYFDDILRTKITSYDLATADPIVGNIFDIDFIGNTVLSRDPYFNIDYSVHPQYSPITADMSVLKITVMTEMLSNYKGLGVSMFQTAVKIALFPNDNAITTSSLPVDWTALASAYPLLTPQENDLIWQNYKTYYLSAKSQLNQYLMDVYGFHESPGLFNGCIGVGEFNPGIVGAFNVYPVLFLVMYSEVLNAWGPSLSNLPTTFCDPIFDTKQARIIRVDNLANSSTPSAAAAVDGSAQADYMQWQQTGLCPLTMDMERLLERLGVDNLLNTASSMADVNEFVPDLYTAFTNGAYTNSSTMQILGTINSTNMELAFSENGTTECTVILSELSNLGGPLPWSSYNFGAIPWYIYDLKNSYPTGVPNQTSVIVVAGIDAATAQEYVMTYTSCVDLNGCQADYLANNQDDPDCAKEEEFESAMLGLMQALIISGDYTQSGVNLNTISEFSSSVLAQHFGGTVTWDGSTGIISFFGGSYQIGFIPSTSTQMINSYDLVDGIVYSNLYNVVNTVAESVNEDDPYIYVSNTLTDLELNCSCEEMMSDQALSSFESESSGPLLALLNHFWINYTTISIGDELPEIDAFTPFTSMNGLNLELFSLTRTPSSISFALNEVGTIDNISFTTPDWSLPPYSLINPVVQFTNIEIDLSTTPQSYTLTLLTECSVIVGSGENSTTILEPCEVEINGVLDGDRALFEVNCDECDTPNLLAPISCTDAYTAYSTFMNSTFSGDLLPDDPIFNEDSIFTAEYIGTQENFCNSSYAYIWAAYNEYILDMNITSVSDIAYLSIGEFGTTGLGYDYTTLSAAIDAYVLSDFDDESLETYLTWNEYVANEYLTGITVCPPFMPTPVFPAVNMDFPCDQWENNINAVNAQNQQSIYLDQMGDAFVQAYIEDAIASVEENFSESHLDKEYHYTLYYYDRAGNLIQTVPPKGVERFEYTYGSNGNEVLAGTTQAYNDDINTQREDSPDATTNGILAPDHKFETKYRYNSLNQLVYQTTPDGGISRFAYDALGRLIMSQNAKQKLNKQYSYTKYDHLGRVIEVGELTIPHNAIQYINEIGRYVVSVNNAGGGIDLVEWDGVNLSSFPDNLSMDREEVTRSIYDELYDEQGNQILANIVVDQVTTTFGDVSVRGLFGLGYAGDNTRNRIVGVVYQETYDPNINNYENASYYDYDVHGNVKHLIQINNDLRLKEINHHVKHFDYSYDLVSGNVNSVTYQKDAPDQYIHRYCYDSDNRITIAETSKDGFVFEKDAKYFYYDHGPLARTEIAEDKVQACDYAYTIQGWIKTVNGEEIDESTMMGLDGLCTTLNSQVARDAHGFSLSYFDGDYQAQNTDMLSHSQTVNFAQHGASLFNGNIRSMYTSLSELNEVSIGTHKTKYAYDQLNRIKEMEGANVIASLGSSLYFPSNYNSSYSFDENGNLESLTRNANDGGTSVLMDDFSYKYEDGFNGSENNRLSWVLDQAGVSDFGGADIDNSMGVGNYEYDEIGQLTQDLDEDIIYIKWKVTNKVEEIGINTDTDLATAEKIIHFDYDAMGNRIAKHVIEDNGDLKSTFYILDAQGNCMSIYEHINNYAVAGEDPNDFLALAERNMYGSSRLGLERVDAIMDYAEIESDVHDYDLNDFVVQPSNNFCDELGWHFDDYDNGVLIQADHSISLNGEEITVSHTSFDAYSAWMNFNTIVGEQYTFSFEVDNLNAQTLDVNGFNCTSGMSPLFSDVISTPNTYSYNFIAIEERTRVKWRIVSAANPGYTSVTMSNITVIGQGDVFGSNAVLIADPYFVSNEIGDKRYQLSNHLGNVLEVVTDRKLPKELGSTGTVDYYTADVVSYSDYYPYGMVMPNRNASASDYRYGFQDQEKDDEVKGEGNSYDFGARMYDPRVGRFFKRDNFEAKSPFQSPYLFAGNTPIMGVDVNGDSLYVLFWVTGNQHTGRVAGADDEMFRAAAWTRKRNIEEFSFDPAKDKVVVMKVTDLNHIKYKMKWATKKYSKTYGKTKEVGYWSHSGQDGPTGSDLTSGGNQFSDKFKMQMSEEGWGQIDYNWGNNGNEVLNFYGCRNGKADAEEENNNFTLNISALGNAKNVTVSGQKGSSYPSLYNNTRQSTSSMRDGNFKGKEIYMVGGQPGKKGFILGVAYQMSESKNGVSTGSSFQNGKENRSTAFSTDRR
jgi:RHS repeat-associated protein